MAIFAIIFEIDSVAIGFKAVFELLAKIRFIFNDQYAHNSPS